MPLIDVIAKLGEDLEFEVKREVPASDGAWVDIVWLDRRLAPSKFGIKSYENLRHVPVLPVVAFEVELATGGNAKHVKDSVSNPVNLGAKLSVIVIGDASIEGLKKRVKASAENTHAAAEKKLMDRVYGWVFAEAQRGSGRTVIMSKLRCVHGLSVSESLSTPTQKKRQILPLH